MDTCTTTAKHDSFDLKKDIDSPIVNVIERHVHPNALFLSNEGPHQTSADSSGIVTDYKTYKSCYDSCMSLNLVNLPKDSNFRYAKSFPTKLRYDCSFEERAYDEPCTGNLGARAWFCCPGVDSRLCSDREHSSFVEKKNFMPHMLETVDKAPTFRDNIYCSGACERLQQQLDEQAQRYEQQLTELHSVIAELTKKLHIQKSLAIAEEDEFSETCTSPHDDSITCPLEVSELEPNSILSDTENKLIISESHAEVPSSKLVQQNSEDILDSPNDEIKVLKQEIAYLRIQLEDSQKKLQSLEQKTVKNETSLGIKSFDLPESTIEADCVTQEPYQDFSNLNVKSSNKLSSHRTRDKDKTGIVLTSPVSKMAAKIKLKTSTIDSSATDFNIADLPTAVAEHMVGDILQEGYSKNELLAAELEIRQLNAKLENVRAQNEVLSLTLSNSKADCDRMALLCGKYESNAVALSLALGMTDRAIEAYDVLLALLETELSLDESDPDSVKNRISTESVAKQLLSFLDENENSSEVLFSPWQSQMYNSVTEITDKWTSEDETRLREHVSRLKAERYKVQGTYVSLESPHIEQVPEKVNNNQDSRKMDLEFAVLIQELMSLREDKSDLHNKFFKLEKEKQMLKLKFNAIESQQRIQSNTLKNIQAQLRDLEAMFLLVPQNREINYLNPHEMEHELMQAFSREARLKVRLQDLANTIEKVTQNSDVRNLDIAYT